MINWILVIGVIIIMFLLFENLKHHFVRKSIRIFFALTLFFVVLVIMAAFVDLKSFFDEDNFFLKTGNAVVDAFKDNLGDVKIIDKEDMSDLSENTFNYIKKANLTRKLYKED